MATVQGAFSNTKWLGIKLDYYEVANSVNTSNNTSIVRVDIYAITLNGGNGGTSYTRNFYVTVNNERKSISVPGWSLEKNQTKKLGTLDFNVKHNDDGSKTVSISSSYSVDDVLGSSTLSATLKLTTIARASTVGCSDFYIESSTNIVINSASSNFRHTLKYSFENLSGTIVEKTALTTYAWTPNADEFYEQIPNDLQKTGTITCETYNETTLIGTKTCNFTARVDKEKNRPNVSLNVIDTNEITKALTGDENVLVKYFSNAKATITASAKNYATIKSYQLNNMNAEAVSTINSIETNKFVVKAIDSRDIDNISDTVTKQFIDYVRLAIKSVDIDRVNPTSDQIRMNLDGFYFNNSFGAVSNELIAKIRYKEQYGEFSDYYTFNPNVSTDNTLSLSNYDLNILFDNVSFDYQKSYIFEIYINDKLMTINQEVPLKRGLPTEAIGEDFVHIYGDLEVDGEIISSNSLSGSIIIKRW